MDDDAPPGAMDTERLRRVAHDLRNVLVSLHGIATELEADGSEEIQPAVRELIRTAELANRLSRQLLAPDRAAALAVACEPRDVLDAGRAAFTRIAAPFELTIDAQPTGAIPMPPDSLRRVLINLVRNARDAVGADGRIRIALSSVDDATLGRCARIDVIDDGRPDPSPAGPESTSGLGLTIVQELVASAKGTVEIRDDLGPGWRVRIQIPLLP